ncbi:transporter substrate-binding domain-containing protein [Marinobacter salinisoli]|uniref:diguanylate cyclase n=1 Tax=Marinobacter salinisoli TaxID=2769486 RepID=A0ABX7MMJ2_9GAMM|nr:transporter substrate-binding domain-containing protein [Marinobacter salinisoli]QSP93369.1 transporter substrate-binding domain-containing protein [Marinobacter salinisoli]
MIRWRTVRFLTRISACALLIVHTALAAQPAEGLRDSDTAVIGITVGHEPFSFFEGRTASGYAVDLVNDIVSNSLISVDFRGGSRRELVNALLSGSIDAIDEISATDNLAGELFFTDPYHIRQTYMMEDGSDPVGAIESLQQLEGLIVGVEEGRSYIPFLKDQGIQVVVYPSVPRMVEALAFGWVDVIFGPRLSMSFHANEAGFHFLNVNGRAPLGERGREELRIGVRRDKPELFRKLQEGLKAIPDARKDQLQRRWADYGGSVYGRSPGLRLSDTDRIFLARLGPVRVGFRTDGAPFSFKDGGALRGLSVDILNRLAELTDLRIIPVTGQMSDLKEMFQNSEIELLVDASTSDDSLSAIKFTEPYHHIPQVVFSRLGRSGFSNLASLREHRVGMQSDASYLNRAVAILGGQAALYDTQEAMFQALSDREIDFALADLHGGNYWVNELGITGVTIVGEVEIAGETSDDLRFGVPERYAKLADILDQALAAISPIERRMIENHWFGPVSLTNVRVGSGLEFSAREREWLEDNQWQITYCIAPDALPLEGVNDDNVPTGVAAELLLLFGRKSDVKFKFIPTESWAASLEAVREGQCDILPMAMKTPSRTSFLSFTEPYLQVPNVVVGPSDARYIDSLGDFRGKRLGLVKSYALLELFQYRYPRVNFVEVENEQQGLEMMQEQELDGYIMSLARLGHVLHQEGIMGAKVLGSISEQWFFSVAVSKGHWVELGIMEKLVASLTEEERTRLEDYWRNIRIEQSVDYSLLLQVFGVALLIGLALTYWNRKLGRVNAKLAEANGKLERMSATDPLTQVGNRNYFDEELVKSFEWCKRDRQGFAVAMIDADFFKSINDTYGHDAGDKCLIAIASLMKENFRREVDGLARFGGEEFVIFTACRNCDEVLARLEQLRKAIEKHTVVTEDAEIRFTVSMGVAFGKPSQDESPEEYVKRADEALYEAKQNGRNRLEWHQLN